MCGIMPSFGNGQLVGGCNDEVLEAVQGYWIGCCPHTRTAWLQGHSRLTGKVQTRRTKLHDTNWL